MLFYLNYKTLGSRKATYQRQISELIRTAPVKQQHNLCGIYQLNDGEKVKI